MTAASQAAPPPQQHAFVDPTSIWPTHSIYVCWENPDPKYQSEMQLVQQAVANTWEAASDLKFTGWQRCATINKGIRILIEDSGPHTKGLGRYLDGVQNGMVLNFTFNNWSQSCQTQREFCIKTIAVHEFGHAIGFAHEQNRSDAPGECQLKRQGPDGTLLLTPYDPHSVMNYCNAEYNNNGVLSQFDTLAVQSMYGAHP
ncbi:MAG TPA: M57 family metalloprotease [Pyrinomonadaceae bacterium]|nr:M57 family metalloprotease [Pyrinomonadaceae bacterium]